MMSATRIDLAGVDRRESIPTVEHRRFSDLLDTLPRGPQVFWGLPFLVRDPPLVAVTETIEVPLDGHADYVVIAHACDVSAPISGTDRIPGQVINVGEVLADYVLVDEDGIEQRQTIARRYEIGEVAIWMGHLAFAARPHRPDISITSGELATRPFFGTHATGVVQGVYDGATDSPPPTAWWVYALAHGRRQRQLRYLRIEPRASVPIGIGAITLFRGTGHPLRHRPARIYRVPLAVAQLPEEVGIEVDLGLVGRRVRLQPPSHGRIAPLPSDLEPWPPRWGSEPPTTEIAVEITAAEDATLTVQERRWPVRDLEVLGERRPSVRVELVDATTGSPISARINVRTRYGVTIPPVGHAREISPYWFQDWSPDVRVGELGYAYVEGSFQIDNPERHIVIEAQHGLEFEPTRVEIDLEHHQGSLKLPMRRAFDRGESWMTADTHVHFLSPVTALVEADAEDVDLVNLLATQWGELYTNVGDIGTRTGLTSRGRRVVVGTENRQHHLGHVLLLGTGRHPVLPLSEGGPSESTIGDPVRNALAEWAEQGRKRGGLVVLPHFPEPYSENVADVVLGRVDAVELRYFGPNRDSMDVLAWYAMLDAGLRIPCVAGTDKMSASTALGAARTYADIGAQPRTFAAFRRAVRDGRTFATNGPFVRLTVDGFGPGSEIQLPRSGGRVDVEVEVDSVVAYDAIEIVVNGRVREQTKGGRRISTAMSIAESSWIAARVYGARASLSSIWQSRVAAHTSPVYVAVDGSSRRDPEAVSHLDAVLAGGQLWLETLATRDDRSGGVDRVFRLARSRLRSGRINRRRESR